MIDVPVEVKDALREGTYKKNYRFVVLNEDGTESEIGTIDNDNLVSESVSIDERMCSGDTLKFGLCEGSSLEFQYFGKPNITGKRVQAFVDVIYGYVETYVSKGTVPKYSRYTTLTESGTCYLTATAAHAWQSTIVMSPPEYEPVTSMPTSGTNKTEQYLEGLKAGDRISVYGGNKTVYLEQKVIRPQTYTIPMGFFDVKKCSRQASTGIIKATCYNKLQSEYLDAKANETVAELVAQGEYGYTDRLSLYTLLKELLDGYGIEEDTYSYSQASVSSFGGANLVTIPLCDASGQSTSSKLFLYMSSSSFSLNRDDFYHFYLYTQELKQHCIDEVWGSYKTLYTKVNDTVYTIEQFADTSYTDAWYLCGQIYCRKKVDINTFFFERKGGRSNAYTSEYSECYEIEAMIPVHASVGTTPPVVNLTVWRNYFNQVWGEDYVFADIYKKELSAAQKVRITTSEMESIQDVTLRELQSSVYELSCQFGQLSRVTDLFSGVELNHSRLYPADSLYPADTLYPSGAAASGFKSMYSKLWADEGNVHKWRYLIITYKGLNGDNQEEDFTLQRTVNADGTDDYNMSDNWLFRNLVWTAAQVGDYADAMVAKMQDVTWFPFEMWCAGLPYLETGDEIEIPLNGESYTSYVLQRQLKGIQNLQDTYINGTLDIF